MIAKFFKAPTYSSGSWSTFANDFVFASKETEDAVIYMAAVSLTQEETLLFNDRFDVEIQLRGVTEDGAALATQKYQVPVIGVVNDEVLE